MKKDEYQYGGMPTSDARSRMQNTPGDRMAPVAPVAPVMAPKIEKPVDTGQGNNETESASGGNIGGWHPTEYWEFEKGGKVKKTKEQMDAEYSAKINKQRDQEHAEATKHKITKYNKGKNVTKRDDAVLSSVQKRALIKKLNLNIFMKQNPHQNKILKNIQLMKVKQTLNLKTLNTQLKAGH